MILIISYKEDYTVDFIVDKLNRSGRKYFRLNTEDIDSINYLCTRDSEFTFSLNGLFDFNSVWFRRLKLPEFSANPEVCDYLAGEYEYLFSNLLRNIKAKRWMSKPDALIHAENKIVQLQLAQSLGLKIPNTILTNNKDKIKEFVEKCSKSGTIIKPLFSGRIETPKKLQLIYTNEVYPHHIDSLMSYDLTPCIFQEKIQKEYEIRVTVVDKQIFAASVDSQSCASTMIDWRRERLTFKRYNLPSDIQAKCLSLIAELNTSFGAIDLIKSTAGDYYFLENNPNGQWAWIEMDTGLLISKAIINFLYT